VWLLRFRLCVLVNDVCGQNIHFMFRFCIIGIFFNDPAVRRSRLYGLTIRSGRVFYYRHHYHIVVTEYQFISEIMNKNDKINHPGSVFYIL